MTERSVTVRLKADTASFTAKMVAAGRSAEGAFLGATQAAEKNRAALRTVGNAAGIVGGLAAAGIGMAVKAAADFDQAMSGVESATHGSAQTMHQLREAALQAGADTAFSATEAAGGIENLAKAGVSTADILSGGLRGALNLAAAGQIEVSDAAEYTATALTQFQLKGNQASHVADLLAAGAGKAQGEVGDMANALKYAGVPADNLGVSIEETAGTIALFAKNGIIGEQAGTSMRGMLASLTSPSDKAAEEMDALGISVFDAKGNFLGFDGVAGQLHDRLGDLTQQERANALGRIFGNEQLQAANVLYREGAEGVDTWTRKVNDSGYAAETAAIKMDNLAGDLEQLKGSLETALIGTGEGAQGPLRGMVQNLTQLINKFNDLPQPVKNATFELGALVAVTGGTAFLGSRFIIAISEARTALSTLGITAAGTRTALAGIGRGLTLAGVLYGITKIDEAVNALFHTDLDRSGLQQDLINLGKTGQASGALLETFGGDLGRFATDVDKLEGGLVSAKYGLQGFTDAAFGWLPGTTGFEATENRIKGVDQALTSLVRSGNADAAKATFNQLAAAARKQGVSVQQLLQHLPGYRQAIAGVAQENKKDAEATRDSSQATDKNADARRRIGSAIDTQTQKLNDLVEAQRAAAEEEVQAVYDKAGLISQLRETTKEIAHGTRTLNWNTKAGSDNRVALADLAAQWNNSTGKVQDAKGAYGDMRQEFYRLARQSGATKDQAKHMVDTLLQVPPNTKSEIELPKIKEVMGQLSDLRGDLNSLPDGKPKVTLDTSDARREMARWAQDMSSQLTGIKDEDVRISLATSAASILQTAQSMNIFGKAAGGEITGGVPGKDSVLSLLTPNEHVWTVDEVEGAGGHEVMRRMRRAAKHHALPDPRDLPAFATGGEVALRPRVSGTGMGASTAVVERLAASLAGGIGDALSDKLNEALQFGGGRPLGPGGSLSPGQLVMGQMGVRGQEGKPYGWGASGPNAYDCSGLQSFAYNYAVGMANPYTRRGSTGTMPWGGMKPGAGGYTIGWFTGDPGHMSGNMGGLNIESSGDVGVHTGSTARSPLDPMFNGLAHYDTAPRLKPGLTLAYNGTGADEYVVKGFAGGGEVTPAERKQHREERDQRRQEQREEHRAKLRADRQEARQKAREEAKEARQLDRERARAQKVGRRQFRITGEQDRGEVRSEIAELRSTIRDAFGKDSGAVKAINHLDDRMLRVAKTHDRLIRANEELSDQMHQLKDAQRQYASEVAQSYQHDLFTGSLADYNLQARADRNDARRATHALRIARQHGLSGGLFRDLAASGNLALLQQFAHLNRRQIARQERVFAQRQQAGQTLGAMAGHEVYGDRIHDNSRALHRNERATRENTRAQRHLTRVMEHRVERRTDNARRRARAG